ncbi:hypothetical protein PMIN03_002392 [Paraphaeosphaeria minitans]
MVFQIYHTSNQRQGQGGNGTHVQSTNPHEHVDLIEAMPKRQGVGFLGHVPAESKYCGTLAADRSLEPRPVVRCIGRRAHVTVAVQIHPTTRLKQGHAFSIQVELNYAETSTVPHRTVLLHVTDHRK